MFKYYFFTFFNKEVYIDIKAGRPLSIAIHRDNSHRSVSVWVGWLYILISKTTKSQENRL